MKARGGIRKYLALTGVLAIAGGLFASPASAADPKTSEPLVSTYAWYWEDAQAHDVEGPTGTLTVDTNNEFCPQVPGGGLGNVAEELCAEGRLPVRVRGGEYENPNQISAVTFDTITTIPFGSKILEFKAVFDEAQAGCRDKETAPTGKQCEATAPVNEEGHQLQACLVTELFGEGVARPYKEVPRYTCPKDAPLGKRTKAGGKDGGFQWTFDLTEYAQQWSDGEVPTSSVMITAVEPKDAPPHDTWRVVLLGSVDDGIQAKATFIPAKLDPLLPPIDTGGPTTVPGTPGSPGIPGTPAVPGTPGTPGTPPSSGGAPATDAGAAGADKPAEPGEAKAPVEATGEAAPGTKPTAATELPSGGGLPWYAWIALIGGFAAFSAVRSVVLESAAGIRPDGVLAHIQKLNAERRGGAAAAAGAQPGLGTAFLAHAGGALTAGRAAGRKIAGLGATKKLSSLAGKIKLPGKKA